MKPKPVQLGDTFILPEDRPRMLKRIPQMGQFPPVISYLFNKAYDSQRKRLRKAAFTFDDIQKAIAETGVDLHWVRKETFLTEIARSRRVTEMLAPAIDHGYSIVPSYDPDQVGLFVPVGTPGTLEDKESLNVRIDEIHDAGRLSLGSLNLNGNGDGVIAVLNESAVQKTLWSRDGYKVNLVSAPRAQTQRIGGVYTVGMQKGGQPTTEITPVITCKASTLPNKSRIARIGRELASESVTVLIAATSRHLVALRFDNCRSSPREIARAAFELI